MRVVCWFGLAALLTLPLPAGTTCRFPAIDARQFNVLKRFLAKQYYTRDYAETVRSYTKSFPHYDRAYALRVSAAPVPDSALIAAYVSGFPFCGSGGCTLLVLQPTRHGFRIVGEQDMVFSPVMLLPTGKANHPDLGVWSRGYPEGGHEVAIRFVGRRYKLRDTQLLSHDAHHMTGKALVAAGDTGCSVL